MTAPGTATLTLAGRPRLDATIAAGEVPLNLLIGATAAAGQASPKLETPAPARQAQAPGEPAPPKAAPRQPVEVGGIPERFSHAPIDLSALQAWDGTIKLAAAALSWGGFRLVQADLAFTLADGKATIDRLTGKLWGGDLAATAALDAGEDALSVEAKLTGAQAQPGRTERGRPQSRRRHLRRGGRSHHHRPVPGRADGRLAGTGASPPATEF